MLSFKDYSKVLLRLSKVTDELHDIDKMTGGEFSKMDKKDSSADHTPIGLPIPRFAELKINEDSISGNWG